MSTMLDALRDLGIQVQGDALPFIIDGVGTPTGGTVDIDASGSSQFVSGLLLAGARFSNGITVRHTGGKLPSMSRRAAGGRKGSSGWVSITAGIAAGVSVRHAPW